jgi:hypothetical protein
MADDDVVRRTCRSARLSSSARRGP